MNDNELALAIIDELLDWSRYGQDHWRTRLNELLREDGVSISSVHDVEGPTILSVNARHQSFDAFVERLEAIKARLKGVKE